MTSSSVLAALESVPDDDVEYILDTPWTKRGLSRTAKVDYYLHTSPVATWERLAGRCLYEDQDSAAKLIMRGRPKPEEGMEI